MHLLASLGGATHQPIQALLCRNRPRDVDFFNKGLGEGLPFVVHALRILGRRAWGLLPRGGGKVGRVEGHPISSPKFPPEEHIERETMWGVDNLCDAWRVQASKI